MISSNRLRGHPHAFAELLLDELQSNFVGTKAFATRLDTHPPRSFVGTPLIVMPRRVSNITIRTHRLDTMNALAVEMEFFLDGAALVRHDDE